MGVLTKIREMPDNQKKIFSLISAVVLTLVIVVVWFSFTSSSANTQLAAEQSESKLSSLSPMQVIKDEFSKAFSGFNSSVASSSPQSTSTLESTSTIPIEIVTEATTSSTSKK